LDVASRLTRLFRCNDQLSSFWLNNNNNNNNNDEIGVIFLDIARDACRSIYARTNALICYAMIAKPLSLIDTNDIIFLIPTVNHEKC
jgi:hypothetical protein